MTRTPASRIAALPGRTRPRPHPGARARTPLPRYMSGKPRAPPRPRTGRCAPHRASGPGSGAHPPATATGHARADRGEAESQLKTGVPDHAQAFAASSSVIAAPAGVSTAEEKLCTPSSTMDTPWRATAQGSSRSTMSGRVDRRAHAYQGAGPLKLEARSKKTILPGNAQARKRAPEKTQPVGPRLPARRWQDPPGPAPATSPSPV
jgi:hypothetical protein